MSGLQAIAADLAGAVNQLTFAPPVTHVYNPLSYAWQPHADYLRRYGGEMRDRVVFVGMNPGPWGMVQTGVPFGEVISVRDWMGIEGEVARPPVEHPKRPVEGFSCRRSEVSGARLWGWARERFGTPERFFRRFFVLNYCPLAFMEASGRNRTPDRLPRGERAPLDEFCRSALHESIKALEPQIVIGVGTFAEKQVKRATTGLDVPVGRILHPSPASPAANRGWAERAEAELGSLGVVLPS